MATFQVNIPLLNGTQQTITFASGGLTYVVGTNGSGKSALMQSICAQHVEHSKWIIAHRTLWLKQHIASPAGEQIMQFNNQRKSHVHQARTIEYETSSARVVPLAIMVQQHNSLARKYMSASVLADTAMLEILKRERDNFKALNEVFAAANLNIVISVAENDGFFASKCGGHLYPITELSDGEKSALMLCVEVLTAQENSLILLDEPERHLHPAIIVPLVRALVSFRPDCAFVLATHNLDLPLADNAANVILVRRTDRLRAGFAWELEVNTLSDAIPEDIRTAILGARRKVLFVEGEGNGSLDKPFYSALFPEVTVEHKTGCIQVERSVDGMRSNQNLNWVEAYGLVDGDDRQPVAITRLEARSIYCLPAYSVEYFYYGLDTIRHMASILGPTYSLDPQNIFRNATGPLLHMFQANRTYFCARLCEKKVREQIERATPDHTAIATGAAINIQVDVNAILADEYATFDALFAAGDVDGLMKRYPFRSSQIISVISSAFGVSRMLYERAVITQLREDDTFRAQMIARIGTIGTILAPARTAVALPTAAAATGTPPEV